MCQKIAVQIYKKKLWKKLSLSSWNQNWKNSTGTDSFVLKLKSHGVKTGLWAGVKTGQKNEFFIIIVNN